MSETIEQLHGRLNPTVLKEQAIEQFHDAAETIKQELKERLQDAKETLMAELKEVKETVRVDVLDEIDTVRSKLNDEVVQAKAAVREATIGKVENMMQDTKDRIHGASRSVKDTVADNPIPAALAGVGLAWLFIEGRRRRGFRLRERARFDRPRIAGQGDDDTSIGTHIRDIGQQTGRKVADATHEAVSAAGSAAQGAKETVADIAHRAQDRASELSSGAVEQARRVQRRGSDLFRDNPIAVGAALLAAGTIVGLAVPRTETEDEWLGGARDNVIGKAQKLAHEAFGKAGDAVKRIAEDKSQDESSGSELRDDYH
jgi:ElaB/YqjD/DUF883 family membrane-anchored ribosome-binding protein